MEKSYKSHLRRALTGGDTTSYNYFEGREINVNEITGLAGTMPLFAGKCLVLIKDSGLFRGGAGADELTEYMGGTPEPTCLMFVKSEVDKKSRLYKAVEKYGYAAKLNHQEPARLARWVAGILSKSGRKITGRTMGFLLSKAGDDMENTGPELEKLISYTLGCEVITDEDVETICTTQVTNEMFDMIIAIAARQTRKAVDLYEDLLTLEEPPMYIFSSTARQFNQILQVKDPMGKGMDKSTIASRLKLQSFVARRIMLQARIFTREQVLSYVDPCADAEESAKTGKLQDRLAVELLIANKYE